MDSLTLLAETSNTNVRPRSLRTDDREFVLLVRVHEEPDETLFQVRARLKDVGFFHVVLDEQANQLAQAIAWEDKNATKLIRQRLKDEHGIELTTDGYHLMAEHPNGSRRRAKLQSDDERFSARATVHFDEDGEETLMRIRLYIDGFGATQLVLSDRCRIRANISGRTDSDAFERVRGELARQGIELQ
jgi:hypothetical protein